MCVVDPRECGIKIFHPCGVDAGIQVEGLELKGLSDPFHGGQVPFRTLRSEQCADVEWIPLGQPGDQPHGRLRHRDVVDEGVFAYHLKGFILGQIPDRVFEKPARKKPVQIVRQPSHPATCDQQRRVLVFAGVQVAARQVINAILAGLVPENEAVDELELVNHLHDPLILAFGHEPRRLPCHVPQTVRVSVFLLEPGILYENEQMVQLLLPGGLGGG